MPSIQGKLHIILRKQRCGIMNAKVIAVWGANGSGKTTTAVNLAFSLSRRNFTVGLISSNIYYGEMQMLLRM